MIAITIFICPVCGSLNFIEHLDEVYVNYYFDPEKLEYDVEYDTDTAELLERKCADCDFDCPIQVTFSDLELVKKFVSAEKRERLLMLIDLLVEGKVTTEEPRERILKLLAEVSKYREVREKARSAKEKLSKS